jgi:hypothetical protein
MTMENLVAYRKMLKSHLRWKIRVEDWHAVADTANDLREVDVQIEMVRR